MSKGLGKYSIDDGSFSIQYRAEDDSFSHELGTRRQTILKIKSSQYYLKEVDQWVDTEAIERSVPTFEKYIVKLVQEHFESSQ